MKMMNRSYVLILLLVAFGFALRQHAKAESPHTPAEIMDHAITSVEKEFVSAADAMPEDKYSFAPTNGEFKGVRTFAQQVKHVAAVNYMVAGAILQEKPPVDLGGENGPDSIKSKAEIMGFLKDSFSYLHKAIGTLTAKNLTEEVKPPWGGDNMSKLALATIAAAHPFDHYGQMVEYLRMNGIIPPASRGQ